MMEPHPAGVTAIATIKALRAYKPKNIISQPRLFQVCGALEGEDGRFQIRFAQLVALWKILPQVTDGEVIQILKK